MINSVDQIPHLISLLGSVLCWLFNHFLTLNYRKNIKGRQRVWGSKRARSQGLWVSVLRGKVKRKQHRIAKVKKLAAEGRCPKYSPLNMGRGIRTGKSAFPLSHSIK